MFKNLTIGKKIAFGFAIPLVMLTIIVASVSVVANRLKGHASSTNTVKYAGLAREMKFHTVQVQQWLTDISATRAKDGLDDGFELAAEHSKAFEACLAEFEGLYKTRQDSMRLEQIAKLKKDFEKYHQCGEEMAKAYIEGGPELGNKIMGQFDQAAEDLTGALDPFVEYHVKALDESLATIVSSSRTLQFWVLIVGGSALIGGALLAWLIGTSITKPINRIILGLAEGSEQVNSAAGQVSSASQSLAEGATEQAAGLEETSSSLEEMSSMTKQNADNAQQANTLASEARKAADTGSESMGRMNSAIQEIQKSSDETAKIIKVIDEIAFQTNLLALNAAVEAARAGEAGKGFAVVAEEVRNLAMRSAEAAKNTSELIEESVKNSKNGVDIANEVGKVLEEIVTGIGKTSDLVGEIAAASAEQSQGIDQVNTAVNQMDKVTQQNAANAEESASASEELSAQAEQMNEIVEELSALVGGSSGNVQTRTTATRTQTRTSLNVSDHTFHQIAAKPNTAPARPQKAQTKAQTKVAAEKAIPLNDSDNLSDFNS